MPDYKDDTQQAANCFQILNHFNTSAKIEVPENNMLRKILIYVPKTLASIWWYLPIF